MTSELVPRRKSFAAMVALVLEEAKVVDQHVLEKCVPVARVFFGTHLVSHVDPSLGGKPVETRAFGPAATIGDVDVFHGLKKDIGETLCLSLTQLERRRKNNKGKV